MTLRFLCLTSSLPVLTCRDHYGYNKSRNVRYNPRYGSKRVRSGLWSQKWELEVDPQLNFVTQYKNNTLKVIWKLFLTFKISETNDARNMLSSFTSSLARISCTKQKMHLQFVAISAAISFSNMRQNRKNIIFKSLE